MSSDNLLTPVTGVLPTRGGYYLWRYLPSLGAAVLFLLLFLGSFFFVCWKIWKTKAKFCIVFAIGCFCYGARAGAHSKTNKIMPYAIQNMFIVIAPVLFAASIYMVLGRIIRSVRGDKFSIIPPAHLTRTFVLGDVISFLIQAGASGMMVIQKPGLATWGERIVIIGLVIQVIMFGLFCGVALLFHKRMRAAPTMEATCGPFPWEQNLCVLYVLSVLIMARSIFRVVEFAQGSTGYSLSHEWTLYTFDGLLMWIASVIFPWKLMGNVPNKKEAIDMQPLGTC